MRRVLFYITGVLLALLLLVFLGLYWLFYTTAGARFALTTLPAAAGIDLSLQKIEGRLVDRLLLTGVRVQKPRYLAQFDRLQLVWEPRELLSGNLVVRELTLAGVRIQDDTPPTGKPPLAWPRVSGVITRFQARVARFELKGLDYRRLKAQPIVVNDLTFSLSVADGLLAISDLKLTAPQGSSSGEIVMGLWRPSLRVDLAVVPARPVQRMDLFSLQARLFAGRSPEQVAGPIALAGKSGGQQRLELTGELGVTPNAFNLRRLSLLMPGRRGTVTGAGSMTLTAKEPLFALALKLEDLDLQSEVKRPTRLSGTLNFSGSQSGYRGNFSLANSGPGWQSASLAGGFQGGKSGVKLAPLSGRLLDGRLAGALEVELGEVLRVRGTLAGRRLNPGRLSANWRGEVNFNLAGSLRMPKKGELRGSLRGNLLESRLHGQELRGEVAAGFAGKRLRVDRLLLVGRGFDLNGSGELDRRLDLQARVTDLSRLVPNAAGALDANAWLRWRANRLAGAAAGRGSGLAVGGVAARALQFSAALGEGKGYPVQAAAALSGVKAGRVQVESARLALTGNAARHTLKADLASPGAEAHLVLAGGYGNGAWRGELSTLSGRDAVGPWSLVSPAHLMASRAGFRIAPLVVTGLPGERVELAGEVSRPPLSGGLRGSWSGINLARANEWLDRVQLAGGSSGEADLRLLPGKRLFLSARAEAQATVVTDGHRVSVERLTARVEGGDRGLEAALDLWLEKGEGDAHLLFSSASPATLALPAKGSLKLQFSNFDLALLRPVTPSDLTVQGRLAGLLSGELLPERRVELTGNAALAKGHLLWRTEGDSLDATLDTAELSFSWSGRAGATKENPGVLQLSARAAATGTYRAKGQQVAVSHLTLRADADQRGTRAELNLTADQGGALRATLSSPSPAGLGMPERGEFAAEWGGIRPSLMKPFLPGPLNLQGEIAGQASGRVLPGGLVELSGATTFSQGRAQWQGKDGELNANLRSAELSFDWRGETLAGKLTLALAEYGHADGSFVLPVPARLPVAVNPQGVVQGAFLGKVEERGFLTAVFPGLLQESHGDLDVNLALAGVWSAPRLTGTLQLAKAGAYLPSAGISVTDLRLSVRLSGDEIRIDNLKAVSGPGNIEGSALFHLKEWQLTDYHGTLTGNRFRTVYLPELQLTTSPQLAFQGTGDTVTITGSVAVPEMLISGPPMRPIVTPSKDVILVGAPPAPPRQKFPLVVDGRIHILLGDKVQVKASGIDAKLGGGMDLVLKGIDNIISSGEIRVVKGTFKAYGLDLDIVRGRLYYVGEPVSQPTLDILALRKVDEVKAGVTVGGRLNAPVVKLYSEPSMADVDILAYMVLGHPLSSTSTDQASMVATAASSLFSLGQSDSVQEQIKQRLGLSVLGVETVTPSTAGLMGYQEVPVTPTGAAPAKPPVGESLLTVGKYLTPKLYLSYGRSLVTGGSLFRLRYDIFRHWQVETESGTESGADLYYKLDFK